MRNTALRVFLICFPLLFAGCATAPQQTVASDPDGLGGTGILANTDGIGGTGHSGGDEDGIGGTGLWASVETDGDVALVGAVTALEALEVNNFGFIVPEDLTISANGEPAPQSILQLGQVIELRAGLLNGRPTAKAIQIFDPVVGQIEEIDGETNTLVVNQQTVRLTAATRITVNGANSLTDLVLNDAIRVSGVHDENGHVVASLITDKNVREPSVSGQVVIDVSGNAMVGTVALGEATVKSGGLVFVSLPAADTGSIATRLTERADYPYAGSVRKLSVQFTPGTLSHRAPLPAVAASILPPNISDTIAAILHAKSARVDFYVAPSGSLTLKSVTPLSTSPQQGNELIIPRFVPQAPGSMNEFPIGPTAPGVPSPTDQITLPGRESDVGSKTRLPPGDVRVRPLPGRAQPVKPSVRPTAPSIDRPIPSTDITVPRP